MYWLPVIMARSSLSVGEASLFYCRRGRSRRSCRKQAGGGHHRVIPHLPDTARMTAESSGTLGDGLCGGSPWAAPNLLAQPTLIATGVCYHSRRAPLSLE